MHSMQCNKVVKLNPLFPIFDGNFSDCHAGFTILESSAWNSTIVEFSPSLSVKLSLLSLREPHSTHRPTEWKNRMMANCRDTTTVPLPLHYGDVHKINFHGFDPWLDFVCACMSFEKVELNYKNLMVFRAGFLVVEQTRDSIICCPRGIGNNVVK